MFEKLKAKKWAKLSPDEKTCYYILFQVKRGVSLDSCLLNLGYKKIELQQKEPEFLESVDYD